MRRSIRTRRCGPDLLRGDGTKARDRAADDQPDIVLEQDLRDREPLRLRLGADRLGNSGRHKSGHLTLEFGVDLFAVGIVDDLLVGKARRHRPFRFGKAAPGDRRGGRKREEHAADLRGTIDRVRRTRDRRVHIGPKQRIDKQERRLALPTLGCVGGSVEDRVARSNPKRNSVERVERDLVIAQGDTGAPVRGVCDRPGRHQDSQARSADGMPIGRTIGNDAEKNGVGANGRVGCRCERHVRHQIHGHPPWPKIRCEPPVCRIDVFGPGRRLLEHQKRPAGFGHDNRLGAGTRLEQVVLRVAVRPDVDGIVYGRREAEMQTDLDGLAEHPEAGDHDRNPHADTGLDIEANAVVRFHIEAVSNPYANGDSGLHDAEVDIAVYLAEYADLPADRDEGGCCLRPLAHLRASRIVPEHAIASLDLGEHGDREPGTKDTLVDLLAEADTKRHAEPNARSARSFLVRGEILSSAPGRLAPL
ncbi:hypothetical protein [Bradyrhizobium japonicum]|uniref:hypothetical protein n=1 Tax=Bradyrhizobium japonicum TaxID=375 RepID=UPI00200CF2C5|nr:hypothetical protein [Bradyrhizobium japonicum]WLB23862.1 hypothetical protein QIH95_08895 [Bradyrhizobium japonicum]